MKAALALAAAAVLGAGCGSAPDESVPPPAREYAPGFPGAEIPEALRAFCGAPGAGSAAPLPEGAEPLNPEAPFQVQNNTLYAPFRCVLRTRAEWDAFRSASGLLDLPELPQDRVMLAVGLGWQPSTGYSIRIDTVAAAGGATTAVVRGVEPDPESHEGALETSPVFAVLVPAPADSVLFLERR